MKIVPRIPVETADASRGKSSPRQFLVNTGLVVGFFVGAYFLLGFAAQAVVWWIPGSWESELDFTGGFEALQPAPPHVQEIFDKLAAHADLELEPSLLMESFLLA